jgi:hypothetical protein
MLMALRNKVKTLQWKSSSEVYRAISNRCMGGTIHGALLCRTSQIRCNSSRLQRS